jgi:hypothetical protein
LLSLIGELDARRLYLGEGCSSLFVYCTQLLRLSEHAAYHRIEAARAARRFPVILDLVAAGDVTLTTVALLRRASRPGIAGPCWPPRATKQARSRTTGANLAPRSDARALACGAADKRRVSPGISQPAVAGTQVQRRRPINQPATRHRPLAPERFLLRVTVSGGRRRSCDAPDLMRHSVQRGSG